LGGDYNQQKGNEQRHSKRGKEYRPEGLKYDSSTGKKRHFLRRQRWSASYGVILGTLIAGGITTGGTSAGFFLAVSVRVPAGAAILLRNEPSMHVRRSVNSPSDIKSDLA